MYYVNCAQCGRLVMAHNTCGYCHTLDVSQKPKTDFSVSSGAPSAPNVPLLAALVTAGATYWQTTDPVATAAAAFGAGLFARTSVGRTIFKVVITVVGLALAWLIWDFFNQLSKTYR